MNKLVLLFDKIIKFLDYEVLIKAIKTWLGTVAAWTKLPAISQAVDLFIRKYIADPLFQFLSYAGAKLIIRSQVGAELKAVNLAKDAFIVALESNNEELKAAARADYEIKLQKLVSWNRYDKAP